MADENYLLAAVQKLTVPYTSKVMQSNDAGITCISEVEHEPLLVTLRDAVVGGIGSHAGSSSSARERIPFDAGAMELFDDISRQVNEWYLSLEEQKEHLHLHTRLGRWYLDYENRRRAGKVTDDADALVTRVVEGWVRRIEGMFDPPSVIELTEEHWVPVMVPKTRVRVIDGERVKETVLDAEGKAVMKPKLNALKEPVLRLVDTDPAVCPSCGATYAIDPKTGDRITALVVEYRELGEETVDQSNGVCRSCGTIWHGGSGVRALRWLIEHPEEGTALPTVAGYTAQQLLGGLRAAIADHNMKSVAALIGLLKAMDPELAAQMREVIEAITHVEESIRTNRSAQTRLVARRKSLYDQITHPTTGETND
ncbi:MAG: zinc-ribbon domain-containing protein [Actinobacteria bacterium]|nr:zinc-ribbon domain-containing protein [Actinomycetota bacterium]